ncbi:hypothetical protein OIU74_028448, partial [Salix koriyanagi]|jgi:hypothetical protein
MRQ